MNKTFIISLAVLVVVAIGFGIYSSSNNSKKDAAMMEKQKMEQLAMEKEQMMKDQAMKENLAMQNADPVMNKEETMVKVDTTMMAKVGSYESYTPAKIALASATHDVVLFFRASWCPTCVALDKDIRANINAIPASLTILDVNYDNSTDLKKKYGVTYQHTFVQVDAQGNLIKKWSGSPTLTAIVSEVK